MPPHATAALHTYDKETDEGVCALHPPQHHTRHERRASWEGRKLGGGVHPSEQIKVISVTVHRFT